MTEKEEMEQVKDEWTKLLVGGKIDPKHVRKHSRGRNTIACKNGLDAILFGIPGSELGKNVFSIIPKKLDKKQFDKNKLKELADFCKDHAKMLEQRGYKIAAKISQERADYYNNP